MDYRTVNIRGVNKRMHLWTENNAAANTDTTGTDNYNTGERDATVADNHGTAGVSSSHRD